MAEKKTLHLVGVGVSHSIAVGMHNYIAQSIDLPWTFHNTECSTVDEALALGKDATCAGLVVTMPYKNSIMPLLDSIDDLASTIGACNNVHRDPNNPELLRGTNTDWIGIKGCLLETGERKGVALGKPPQRDAVLGKAALVVGAGGASRAAVYALNSHFKASSIYVLNRDDSEVAALLRDVQSQSHPPQIVHLKTIDEAKKLETPFYIVGTVPDLEPKTTEELTVKSILEEFLGRQEKGMLLDMCFKPRRTRMMKLAEQLGWPAVDGTHVIGYQMEQQWKLWAGEEKAKNIDQDGAWKVLLEAAENSPGINF